VCGRGSNERTLAFKLTPCDATEIARPAAEVWRELIADRAFGWCRALGGAQWASPRPFGVGATRTMRVGRSVIRGSAHRRDRRLPKLALGACQRGREKVMRTTQQFSNTLPLEMAEAVQDKIKSGSRRCALSDRVQRGGWTVAA